ncbi:MAG: Na+ dependent nucleoside transporter [Verrucomicrobiales bacterium]|nr:Na+ dependent nucleoside transporter [Verrucomicrobiales bacterium]
MERAISIVGIAVILAICFGFSTNRKAIKWKTVAWGIALQVLFALLVLRWPAGEHSLSMAGKAVEKLLSYANVGATFVFGSLADPAGKAGFVFAFYILPTIIFVAAFFAVLYHFGIMQVIIRGAAWLMVRLMGVSGAESLSVAASTFMGQTEAPLTIRPLISKLTESELLTVMTSGMAHISAGIMVAYIGFGIEPKHLLAAVIMAAPATFLVSKILIPETGEPVSGRNVRLQDAMPKHANVLSSIAHGTFDGLHLALNVAAMLIAFLALIALLNGLMGWAHSYVIWFPKDLQVVLGWIFAPIAWLIGVPWKDASSVGSLLGIRMVGNELIAYGQLGPMAQQIDPRSFVIATYALCGFANLSSIGIQIGGIGALAPERKGDLARLGFRAMLAGTAANLIAAAIVALLI